MHARATGGSASDSPGPPAPSAINPSTQPCNSTVSCRPSAVMGMRLPQTTCSGEREGGGDRGTRTSRHLSYSQHHTELWAWVGQFQGEGRETGTLSTEPSPHPGAGLGQPPSLKKHGKSVLKHALKRSQFGVEHGWANFW